MIAKGFIDANDRLLVIDVPMAACAKLVPGLDTVAVLATHPRLADRSPVGA
jgi:hypothetical protein